MFCAPELQVLISGSQAPISLPDWKAHTSYGGGYTSFDRHIGILITYILYSTVYYAIYYTVHYTIYFVIFYTMLYCVLYCTICYAAYYVLCYIHHAKLYKYTIIINEIFPIFTIYLIYSTLLGDC